MDTEEVPVNPIEASQWCLVGNIIEPSSDDRDRQATPDGTKHFSGGTKVYCLPAQWGDGYNKIKVIGRHRGSKQFVTMIVSADRVANWRAKVVYDPEVLRRLAQIKPNWQTKAEIEAYLESLIQRPSEPDDGAQQQRDRPINTGM
jgi:hypothetical protein